MNATAPLHFASHHRHKSPPRHDPGILSVGREVVKMSVLDYQALVEAGAIVDGKPVSPYPVERRAEGYMRPHRFLNTYSSARDIELLCEFVRGPACASLARELGMQDLAARDR